MPEPLVKTQPQCNPWQGPRQSASWMDAQKALGKAHLPASTADPGHHVPSLSAAWMEWLEVQLRT